MTILGVGTPLVDHLLSVDEAYLSKIPGKKYGMETVSYEEMVRLIEESGHSPEIKAGGSAANTIKALGSLGWSACLTGKVGKDVLGEFLFEELQSKGVLPNFLFSSLLPTAHVACFITPDGKRTCRAYLGAAEEMTPQDLNPQYFDGKTLVHIEGYSLLYPGLTKRAMELAKQGGSRISFDLGSFEIVNTYKPLMLELLENYVDVVFANADESFALTNLAPNKALSFLQTICPVSVVMLGENGVIAANENQEIACPAYPVNVLDTTGAGDLFAAGFLHGLLLGQPLEVCAKIGSLVASSVIQVIGAELPKKSWDLIRKEIMSIIRLR